MENSETLSLQRARHRAGGRFTGADLLRDQRVHRVCEIAIRYGVVFVRDACNGGDDRHCRAFRDVIQKTVILAGARDRWRCCRRYGARLKWSVSGLEHWQIKEAVLVWGFHLLLMMLLMLPWLQRRLSPATTASFYSDFTISTGTTR